MAIYVLLQCCKCNNQKTIHLYSYSINKDNVTYNLCHHFTVRYTYICKFKFFTIGWSIVLKVKATCNNCYNDLNFGENTFNSSNYSLETHNTCCHHVFRVNVSGYSYASDTKGIQLQEEEDKRKREQEEKLEQEKERQKVKKIVERQNQESKLLSQEYNFDLNFIDNEMMNLNNALDYELNLELNFDIGEHIEKQNEMIYIKLKIIFKQI